MLRKTILEISEGLTKEEKIKDIAINISRALEEIQNYKIAYILHVENASLEEKRKELDDILSSFTEIKEFIEKSTKW